MDSSHAADTCEAEIKANADIGGIGVSIRHQFDTNSSRF